MTYGNYPDLSKVKKILVIKLRHHGDVLLTSPVFSLLKKALPETHIDAFIYSDTRPMLEGHPAIRHFFEYDKQWKKLSGMGRFFKELFLGLSLVRQKYDLVINLTEGFGGALVCLFSGSRYKLGVDRKGKRVLGKKMYIPIR